MNFIFIVNIVSQICHWINLRFLKYFNFWYIICIYQCSRCAELILLNLIGYENQYEFDVQYQPYAFNVFLKSEVSQDKPFVFLVFDLPIQDGQIYINEWTGRKKNWQKIVAALDQKGKCCTYIGIIIEIW